MPAQRGSYVSRGPARLPRPASPPPRLHSRPTMRKSALSLLCACLLAAARHRWLPRRRATAAAPGRHRPAGRRPPPRGHGRAAATRSPSLLERHQVADDERQACSTSSSAAFSSRQLRAHQPYSLTLGPDFRVRELTYRIDPDRFLQVEPVGAARARFTTEIVTYRREVALVAIRGDIDREHPSLVAALERAGEDVGLAVGIAELFGGDVDFYRDLQPGDVIEVVFEQVLRDGARVGYGDIVAARLTNAGRLLSAFRFQPAGRALRLLRRRRAVAAALLPRVAAQVRAARHVGLLVSPPPSGARHQAAAPRRRLRGADRRAGRRDRRRGRRLGALHRRRRQHRHAPPRRRLREPLPAPVGVRGRRPGRGARVAGPGHRPRRRDRARHRRAPALRAAAQRDARQSGRRAEAQPARGADRARGSGRVRRASRRAGSAVRERRGRAAGPSRLPPTDSHRAAAPARYDGRTGRRRQRRCAAAPKEIACACTAV